MWQAEANPTACRPDIAMSGVEGRPVVRTPKSLRLHRVFDELDLHMVGELNQAARLKDQSVPDPVLITTNGTILAGLGRWRLAALNDTPTISCIEYPLNEEESLRFILAHQQPQSGWNAFVRIRVALTLEAYLQQRALDNMRAGGRYKRLANLPEAQHIDVRQEIARAAGVGARNVSHAKNILLAAHPRLIQALQDGALTIHRAVQWCRLPNIQQLDQFTRYTAERATNQVIRRFTQPKGESISNPLRVLDALKQQEARQPGSVVLRVGRHQSTIVLVGQDLLAGLHDEEDSSCP